MLHDIRVLIQGQRWKFVSSVKQSVNSVAHSLARHAKVVTDDVICIQDSLLRAMERPFYFDSIHISR